MKIYFVVSPIVVAALVAASFVMGRNVVVYVAPSETFSIDGKSIPAKNSTNNDMPESSRNKTLRLSLLTDAATTNESDRTEINNMRSVILNTTDVVDLDLQTEKNRTPSSEILKAIAPKSKDYSLPVVSYNLVPKEALT